MTVAPSVVPLVRLTPLVDPLGRRGDTSAWRRARLAETLLTMVMIGAVAMMTMREMMTREKNPQILLIIKKSVSPTRLLSPLLQLKSDVFVFSDYYARSLPGRRRFWAGIVEDFARRDLAVALAATSAAGSAAALPVEGGSSSSGTKRESKPVGLWK